ncbi:uncharacterized protein LOC125055539 [Pieris napi]|uniref:uncharacterized protein LOC125055539 n=1 Tax=Pieris napi TaxID=78633 RepID=UPI001FBA487A|nr:uncharacterized protein LOC125055539 [Pieris napi]XP_047513958.1 uncharacterized protein LOC125055539 [Pieris napi]
MMSNNYEPRVEFDVNVAKRYLKFRYEEQGRKGTPIYGETNGSRQTFPAIKIHCPFDTTATVLVSCFTDDVNGKYMPHPNKIVRHPKCENGVSVVDVTVKSGQTTHIFKDIALQLIKKNSDTVIKQLDKRVMFMRRAGARDNPFGGQYAYPLKFDMYRVRICFQVLLKKDGRIIELEPLISEPLIDYHAVSDLNILEMCPDEGRITGNTKIMLLIKRVKKTDKISVIFMDKDSKEIPAIVESTQPYVLSNGYGVLICYTPKIYLEDSAGWKEFAVKVRSNNVETLAENMRGFVYKRILYPDSDYSEEAYLKMLKEKKVAYSFIAEFGETMSISSDQENTQMAAQEVYNTPSTSNSFYTQNMQTHPDATPSDYLFQKNYYIENTSNNFHANNVYLTNSMYETPIDVLPNFNSLNLQANRQDYFQDNGTNTGIQQDHNSRVEQQNTQDRPLIIEPSNNMQIDLDNLDLIDLYQDNGTNTGIQQDHNSRVEQKNTQDRPLFQPSNNMEIDLETLDLL